MKARLQFIFSLLIVLAFAVWLGFFVQSRADSATDKNLNIYFLNVGQGDSEYIKLPNKKDILIDGGPDSSVLTELGKVMETGDRKIDLVVLTHPHSDHLNGLIKVLERYEIGEIWESGVTYDSGVYTKWNQMVKEKGIKDTIVQKGISHDFDGLNFKVLSPVLSLKGQKIDNVNNASVINELDYNQFSTLFLGDAELEANSQILDEAKKVTVVKIAHHGSRNGLNKDLFNILRPSISVIEVGAKNTYGHPHAELINYLNSIISKIYRTDQNGTVRISTDGLTWQVKTAFNY